MTEPPPAISLPLTAFDIASQETLLAVQQALADLILKVEALMTEDQTVAAAAARLEADATTENATLTALQGLITALQAQVAAGQPVSDATNAALAAAVAHVDTVTATGTADVTADTPPAPAP